jgi:nicotinamidase-related amidase
MQGMTNRALIVVDVQESFRARPLWCTVSDPDVIANVKALVDGARERGDRVAWILHAEPGTGGVFDPASGHVRVVEELTPTDGEPTWVKTSYNAFSTTGLQQWLVANRIHRLIVCGLRTEQCVETTTRVACDYGYEVTFAIDATATFPIPHPDAPAGWSVEELLADPRTLGTEEIKTRTVYALAGRFADVRTVKEIL